MTILRANRLTLTAAALLLSGCVATGVGPAETALPPEEVPTAVFPTEQSLQEGSDSSEKGRPAEPEGLSITQKRHLYARRVMASCVEHAPNFLTGLKSSALQPAGKRDNGDDVFADRTFKVAASTNGGYCDVRALGGPLDRFAEGMKLAFETRGELVEWTRHSAGWRGVLIIDGQRYAVRAFEESVGASGVAMVADMRKS